MCHLVKMQLSLAMVIYGCAYHQHHLCTKAEFIIKCTFRRYGLKNKTYQIIWFRVCLHSFLIKKITAKTLIYIQKIFQVVQNFTYFIFSFFVKIFFIRIHENMMLKFGDTFGSTVFILLDQIYNQIYFALKIKKLKIAKF